MGARFAAGAALLLALAAVAAQAAQAPRQRAAVEGVWAFETDAYNDGCRMTGRLMVRPATQPGRHACTLTASEVCPDIRVRAEQTCTLTVTGDRVRIDSVVGRVTPDVGYAPDNFSLRLESAARMTGALDSIATAPARFTRPADVPVS